MAIRIAMNVVCDRCMKPFEGQQIEYGTEVPEVERSKLTLVRESADPETGEVTEEVLFSYDDLCPKCLSVVDKAVSNIKMSSPTSAPKQKKRRNGVKTTAVKEGTPEEDLPPLPEEDDPPEDEAENLF